MTLLIVKLKKGNVLFFCSYEEQYGCLMFVWRCYVDVFPLSSTCLEINMLTKINTKASYVSKHVNKSP